MQVKNTNDIATDGHVKVCVYGPSGIGKTSLAKTLPKDEVLILNCEKGLLSVAGAGIDYVDVFSTKDLADAFQQLTENQDWMRKYKTIIWDSTSDMAETVFAEECEKYADKRQAYGSMAALMLCFIKQFRGLDYNVVFITKLDHIKDEITGGLMFGPMFPGQQLPKQMPYIVDAMLALRPTVPDADGKVQRFVQTGPDFQWSAKDRSGQLAQNEPADLQWIFDKIQRMNPLRVWYYSPYHEQYAQFTQREADQQVGQGVDLVRIGSDESKAKHSAWLEKQKAKETVKSDTQPADEK